MDSPEVATKIVTLEGGERIRAHTEHACLGSPCPIHSPSDHHMRGFPQHFRYDRGIMERTCPHGIGHPDPDDIMIRTREGAGVHGCDGCCVAPGRPGTTV